MSSPYINHFLQPDSLIPDPSNPQAWNRYSYTLNNPIRFSDPTGHKACGDGEATNCDTGLLNNPSNHKNKGCGAPNKHCLGKTKQLEGLIRQEIDRRFDPFIGWFSDDFNYEASEFPTIDYYAEQAYEQAGFNLLQIASQNQDNPMTDDDWLNAGVPIEYIYNKGVGAKAPGHQFFLNYMDREIGKSSNYEANYLNALIVTHEKEFQRAKNKYYDQLLSQNGSLQAAWEFLQMTIDVAGPDNPGG